MGQALKGALESGLNIDVIKATCTYKTHLGLYWVKIITLMFRLQTGKGKLIETYYL
jgi:hypothetical protein